MFKCVNCGNDKRFTLQNVGEKDLHIYVEGDEAGIEDPYTNVYCGVCGDFVRELEAYQIYISFDLTN